MSLIADALKRAQEQRAKGKPGKDDDDRARRMLSGSGPLRVETRSGGGVPASVAVAGAVLAVTLIAFGGVVWLAPRAEAGDPGAGSEDPASAAGTVAAPGPEAGTVANVAQSGASVPGPGMRTQGAVPPAEDEAVAGGPPAAGDIDGAAGMAAAGAQAGGERTPVADASEVADAGAATGGPASFTLRLQGQPTRAPADASELFGRALSAHQRGDLSGAAALYRRAIERNPGDPQLHNNLGTVYRALSMPGEALAAFRTAVEVDPSYAPAWSNLGIMLDGRGQDAEAVEAFREALRQDPSNTGARVNLANKYLGLGQVDEARRLLREVLSDAPALPEAHYAMARALERAGEPDQAARHYRTFLELADGRFAALEARVSQRLMDLGGGGE